jgi:orotate phosphoribosyltransferase
MKKNKVIEIFFATPNVVNVSNKDDFEPQPGVFASIYINLKTPLSYPKVRNKLALFVSQHIKDNADYICGIESGGSYYAAAVADILYKKIILFRKGRKKYNIKNHFVGNLPQKDDKVIIVDDVISSGNTISKAVYQLQNIGCKVKVITLFSYCWDQQIAKNLNIKIITLSNAEELIEYGLAKKRLSTYNAQIIRDFIKREESRLAKGVKI